MTRTNTLLECWVYKNVDNFSGSSFQMELWRKLLLIHDASMSSLLNLHALMYICINAQPAAVNSNQVNYDSYDRSVHTLRAY